jgi:DNA-directed RNA polymerase beta' subunit
MFTRSEKFAKTISEYFQKQKKLSASFRDKIQIVPTSVTLTDMNIGLNKSLSFSDPFSETPARISLRDSTVSTGSQLKEDWNKKIQKQTLENVIFSVIDRNGLSSLSDRTKGGPVSPRKSQKNEASSISQLVKKQGIEKKEKIEFSTSYSKISKIQYISIGLASSQTVRNWAEKTLPNGKILGEVTSANTLHHKTFKPLKGGLFCDRIFGPLRDFECACGIQKRPTQEEYQKIIEHKQIQRKFCSICDVEYTWSILRRYQLGYIQLVSPVSHVWYLKANPSYFAILLDFKKSVLEKIIYCTETLTLENSRKVLQDFSNTETPSELFSSWRKNQQIEIPFDQGFDNPLTNPFFYFSLEYKEKLVKVKKKFEEMKRLSLNSGSLSSQNEQVDSLFSLYSNGQGLTKGFLALPKDPFDIPPPYSAEKKMNGTSMASESQGSAYFFPPKERSSQFKIEGLRLLGIEKPDRPFLLPKEKTWNEKVGFKNTGTGKRTNFFLGQQTKFSSTFDFFHFFLTREDFLLSYFPFRPLQAKINSPFSFESLLFGQTENFLSDAGNFSKSSQTFDSDYELDTNLNQETDFQFQKSAKEKEQFKDFYCFHLMKDSRNQEIYQSFSKVLQKKIYKFTNFLKRQIFKRQIVTFLNTQKEEMISSRTQKGLPRSFTGEEKILNFNFVETSLFLFENVLSGSFRNDTDQKYFYVLFLVLKNFKNLNLISKTESQVRLVIMENFKKYKNFEPVQNFNFHSNKLQFSEFSNFEKSFLSCVQLKLQDSKVNFLKNKKVNDFKTNGLTLFSDKKLAEPIYETKLFSVSFQKFYKSQFDSNFSFENLMNFQKLNQKNPNENFLFQYFSNYLAFFILKVQLRNKMKKSFLKKQSISSSYKDMENSIKIDQKFTSVFSGLSRMSNFQFEKVFYKKFDLNSWKLNSKQLFFTSSLSLNVHLKTKKKVQKILPSVFETSKRDKKLSLLLSHQNLNPKNTNVQNSIIQIPGFHLFVSSFDVQPLLFTAFILKLKSTVLSSYKNQENLIEQDLLRSILDKEFQKNRNFSLGFTSKKLVKNVFNWKYSYFLSNFYKNWNSLSEKKRTQQLKIDWLKKNQVYSFIGQNKKNPHLLKAQIFQKSYKKTRIFAESLFFDFFKQKDKQLKTTVETLSRLQIICTYALPDLAMFSLSGRGNGQTQKNRQTTLLIKNVLNQKKLQNQFKSSIEQSRQNRSLYLFDKSIFPEQVFNDSLYTPTSLTLSMNRGKNFKNSEKSEFTKLQNSIYALSYRESWAQEKDWLYFSYYNLAPRKFEDFSIPVYKIRGFDESAKNLNENDKTIQIGAQVVQKLLFEFNSVELQKMDKQNHMLLYNFNKNIHILKTFVKKGFAGKFEIKELKKLCKKRDHLVSKTKLIRKLFLKNSSPSSMILTTLPVLPPDLRPILKMQDQIAASDLNRLYQRVIYRNERLKKFRQNLSIVDPFPLKFSQKLLQEAVDNLIQNGKGGVPPERDSRGRSLKSLSEILKGKQGRFRQYLLGKRVDYSGRSVIVVGPKLKLHECGLPKEIAIELFLPFLIQKILHYKFARTVIGAKTFIQSTDPRQSNLCLFVLSELMQSHPILLNRAPTLHRLGFQAFQPKLIEGRAILLHPLVCPAFNADFDGDQMAVHLPLTIEACAESWKLMFGRNHLISTATGDPILLPSQDMVLGCYYLTNEVFKFSYFGSNSEKKQQSSLPSNSSKIIELSETERKTKSLTSDFYENSVLNKLDVMLSKSILTNKAQKHTKILNRYFNNLNQVMKAYQRQTLSVHSDIWVKWDKSVESLPSADRGKDGKYFLPQTHPLEIRVNLDGSWQEIRLKQLRRFGKNNLQTNQYIRTTPGRVLFYEVVTNCMK